MSGFHIISVLLFIMNIDKFVSGFQGFRVSGFQGFRVSGFQGLRVSGFQGFRVSGSRLIRFYQLPTANCILPTANLLVSGFQGLRVSGFQGFRFQVN